MKKLIAFILVLVIACSLVGCSSGSTSTNTLSADVDNGNQADGNEQQEQEEAPTTTTKATCSHEWQDATCTAAQTCSKCGLEKGSPRAHTFFQGKCTVCSAKSPDYDKVRKWLQDNQRLFAYFKINYEIIDIEVERYKLTRDIDIIADIQDDVHEIADDIADIAAGSAKYEELELLYDACDIDMPLLATSSSTYGYALSARTYAQTATRLVIHYNSLCEDFDLPTIE